jgi:LAO/AO transport system ATPase
VVVGPASWIADFLAGDRAALARALTAVENESTEAGAVHAACAPRLGRALVVGITGAPGAGKSTLVGALVRCLRGRGKTIGVVAVDPSSPFTGGALLGDRVRMTEHAGDPGVFVRSLATRGALGGLTRTTARVVDAMDASGRDVVIVETVGVGQSEIEVAALADVRVVVWTPGAGDAVQAAKAGVLEIADILVVNKADLEGAEATRLMLHAAGGAGEPARIVAATIATTGQGVAELTNLILAQADDARRGRRTGPLARARRTLALAAADRVRDAILTGTDPRLDALGAAVLDGSLAPDDAIKQAIALVLG